MKLVIIRGVENACSVMDSESWYMLKKFPEYSVKEVSLRVSLTLQLLKEIVMHEERSTFNRQKSTGVVGKLANWCSVTSTPLSVGWLGIILAQAQAHRTGT
jgi:hypothetical protein